jgi:CheY-like chemotaxis protein
MSPPVRVALLGFTPFEREHIEPALRAPRRRKPVYQVRLNDLQACNLAVVDADHEAAIVQVLHQKRLASTVMVGNTRHAGAGAHLSRPIHLPSLLDALDELVARAPAMSTEVQRVQDMLASLLASPSTPLHQPLDTPMAASSLRPASVAAAPADATGSAPHRGTALLVDQRLDNHEFLAGALAPLGLDVHRVGSGSEALEVLQTEVFEFVFLATGQDSVDAADGMDGFHTCRLLQRMPPAQPVAPPPTLVLLLEGDNGVNRLRAERAGADAWLTPPWSSEPLLRIVDERDQWLRQNGKRVG